MKHRERWPKLPWRRSFAEVLGVAHVSRDSNFFSLGGHSLMATRLAAMVRKTFGVELELRQVFIRPNLAALAELLPEPKAGAFQEVGPKPVDRSPTVAALLCTAAPVVPLPA